LLIILMNTWLISCVCLMFCVDWSVYELYNDGFWYKFERWILGPKRSFPALCFRNFVKIAVWSLILVLSLWRNIWCWWLIFEEFCICIMNKWGFDAWKLDGENISNCDLIMMHMEFIGKEVNNEMVYGS